MQYIYAQLKQANTCIGVSQLAGEVIQDNLIDVSDHAEPYSLLGQAYDRETGDFYMPEPKPLPPELDFTPLSQPMAAEDTTALQVEVQALREQMSTLINLLQQKDA